MKNNETGKSSNGSDLQSLETELNSLIKGGDILGAFERFYADDVSMQEGAAAPTVGKAANREREQQFVASIAEVHGIELVGSAVSGNLSFSEWVIDATYKGGNRVKSTQVAARTWRDGQIVFERFFAAA